MTPLVRQAGFQSRSQGLSMVSASMYVRRFFKPEAKSQMKEMTGLLREAFREKLEEAAWMDPETREAAKGKLEDMLESIAYPDEVLDEDKLNDLFGGLEMVEEGNFFASGVSLSYPVTRPKPTSTLERALYWGRVLAWRQNGFPKHPVTRRAATRRAPGVLELPDRA